jgi:hypothetical protein
MGSDQINHENNIPNIINNSTNNTSNNNIIVNSNNINDKINNNHCNNNINNLKIIPNNIIPNMINIPSPPHSPRNEEKSYEKPTPLVQMEKKKDFLRHKRKRLRNSKKITNCPHIDKKHYAKNMCSNCYHNYGRDKKAWECGHTDKPHYALGICQTCYQSKYAQNRKAELKPKTEEENIMM